MTTIQWQDTEVQDVTNVEANCSLAHNSFITAITSIKPQFKQHEEPK